MHAISNRNSKQLSFILRFIIRYICVERFTKILIVVSDSLIGKKLICYAYTYFFFFFFDAEDKLLMNSVADAYCDSVNTFSNEVKGLFQTLRAAMRKEVDSTEELVKLQGALEMILASSAVPKNVLADTEIRVE